MRFLNLRSSFLGLVLALGLVGACADEKDIEVTRLQTIPDAAVDVPVGDAEVALAPVVTPKPVITKLQTTTVAVKPPAPVAPVAKPDDKLVAKAAASPASQPVVEDRDALAKDHIEAAREAIAANDVDSAREHAQLAVALAPLSSSAWNTLGRVDMMAGDPDGAAAAFTNATQTNPKNLYAWNNLGLTEMHRQHWDAAVVALEKACETPTSADHIPQAYMFNNLGAAYEHVGRQVDAIAAYRKAAARGSATAKASLARMDDHKAAKADLDLKSWEDAGPMSDIH
jgi:Tfp pilus assembly protein PilF